MSGVKAWALVVCSVVLFVLTAGCFVLPLPEPLAVGPMMALPWALMLAVFAFNNDLTLIPALDGRARANLGFFSIIPGVLLTVRVVQAPLPDFPFEYLPAVLAGGALMTVAATLASRSAPQCNLQSVALGMLMLGLFSLYVAACALTLNRDLDTAEPEIYRSMVMHKHLVRDRYDRVRTYEVDFGTYWSNGETSTVSVDPDLYAQLASGDYACVRAHAGLFHMRWLDARPCPTPNVAPDSPKSVDAPNPNLLDLDAGRYEKLNQQFGDVQRRYESGQIGEQELYQSYRGIYEESGANDQRFLDLTTEYPQSYAAHLLRGIHLYRVGLRARGGEWIKDVPPEQIQRMEEYLQLADQELQASLDLTARPYLSALFLLNVAQFVGRDSERRRWLELGNTIDPANLLVRRRYMITLEPRWRGSYEAMEQFLNETRISKVSPDVVAKLEAVIFEDQAADQAFEGNYAAALDSWSRSVAIYRDLKEDPPVTLLESVASTLLKLNRPADAAPVLEEMLRLDPNRAWAHAQLGAFYTRSGRYDEAWAHLKEGARLSDPWSEDAVGLTLYNGAPSLHISPDHEAGLVWIRKAAQRGDHDAIEFLRTH